MLSLFTFITIWSEWFTSVYPCNIQDLVTHCHTLHQFSLYLFTCKFISVIPNTEQDPLFAMFLAVHFPLLFNSEVNLFLPLKTVCDQRGAVRGFLVKRDCLFLFCVIRDHDKLKSVNREWYACDDTWNHKFIFRKPWNHNLIFRKPWNLTRNQQFF